VDKVGFETLFGVWNSDERRSMVMKIFLVILGLIYVSFSNDYVARGIRNELIRAGRSVADRTFTTVFG
jgi:hypothetical protein